MLRETQSLVIIEGEYETEVGGNALSRPVPSLVSILD